MKHVLRHRAQGLAVLGLHRDFGTQMHSTRVRTVVGMGMWNVLCMQVSLEVPFPALLLSCMAVIYFVIITLKILVCSFNYHIAVPISYLTLTISFFLLPFLCLSTFV